MTMIAGIVLLNRDSYTLLRGRAAPYIHMKQITVKVLMLIQMQHTVLKETIWASSIHKAHGLNKSKLNETKRLWCLGPQLAQAYGLNVTP